MDKSHGKRLEKIGQKPRAALFDLDDTLTRSYEPPAPEMIDDLQALLEHIPIAIVSAAGFARIEQHFLKELNPTPAPFELFVFANNASQCYLRNASSWKLEYSFAITAKDRTRIKAAITESLMEAGITSDINPGGNILDRETKVVFAAIDVKSSAEEKAAWDSDKSKRNALKAALDRRLPDFEVLIGGPITIDITCKGANKAYGVHWLAKHLGCTPAEMLFVGDALYQGGNDAVVIPTGISTRQVSGPDETLRIVTMLLARLSTGDS